MKLRNKKTGEIDDVEILKVDTKCEKLIGIVTHEDGVECKFVYSMYRFNEEWEDYKEPKGTALDFMVLTLTNFIENEPDAGKVDLEDCKQMLSKLKAWKRLRDIGFRFVGWQDSVSDNNPDMALFRVTDDAWETDTCDDLDLLFGGEE